MPRLLPEGEIEIENPEGRVDILACKMAERIAKAVEKEYGLEGLWGCMEEMVEEGFAEYLGDERVEVPGVLREWIEGRR